jgi:hypothetical protein
MYFTSIVSAGAFVFYMAATQVPARPVPEEPRKPAPQEARYDELDHVAPGSLKDLVESSDAIIVAKIVGHAEPRVQTNPLTIRGHVVHDKKVFARYVIRPSEVIKAPKGVEFKDGSVVEEWVLEQGLARFQAGLPAVGDRDVLLFLNYYPYGGTFLISSWHWQLLRVGEGGVQPVTGPSARAAFLKEHAVLGDVETARRSDAWQMLMGEVKEFAHSRGR